MQTFENLNFEFGLEIGFIVRTHFNKKIFWFFLYKQIKLHNGFHHDWKTLGSQVNFISFL